MTPGWWHGVARIVARRGALIARQAAIVIILGLGLVLSADLLPGLASCVGLMGFSLVALGFIPLLLRSSAIWFGTPASANDAGLAGVRGRWAAALLLDLGMALLVIVAAFCLAAVAHQAFVLRSCA